MRLGFFTLRGRKFPHGNFRTSVFCEVRTQDGRRNVSFATVSAAALFRAELYLFPFKDHIRRANGAHLAAHRAGMTFGRRNLFVKALRLFRVERKRKLRWPVQLVTCLRHRVVTVARARQSEGDIRRMCCDLARDDAFADVILVRQAQVLGRSDVAAVSKSGRAGL